MRTKDDIIKMIEDEDVEFVRLQFTDVFGNLKNIAITIGQVELAMNNKYSFEGAALFDGLYDLEERLYLYPDLNSFVVLPWRPQQRKVAKMICDVCYSDGRLFEMSPRTILKKVVAKAKLEGYTFLMNPECEFFLYHTDEDGMPTTISHEKASYFEAGPFDFGENARRDIVLTLEQMGFEIESSHHENAPAQHEIDFAQGESIKTADNVMTFKLAVRAMAKRFGLYATFMPKPRVDCAGSGMHLNVSMFKDGKNLFNPKEDGSISDEARYFIGGLLKHAEGMSAITNPTVNSYKRLLSGYQAPYYIDWTDRGEAGLVTYHDRLGERKVELRFPDPSSNPYLVFAVTIAAGLDGIKNQIDPGEPNLKGEEHLPGHLKGAIKLMERDELLSKTLGKQFVEIYSEIKNQEWNEYMTQVSAWEIERYLQRM